MFHKQVQRQAVTQIFFLLLLISIGVGMTRSVSADSGPLYDDGIITGQIVNSNGEGVQGISVILEKEKIYNRWGITGAETDANGNFTIENITRGRYQVRIRDYRDRYGVKYVGGGLQSSSATVFDVLSNEPIVINEVLEPSASVSGLVSAPAHVDHFQPLATAYYFDTAFGRWIEVDSYYERVDGNYVLSGLGAGEYVIGAYEYFDDDFQTTYFPEASRLEDATPIRVASGDRLTDVDFSIITRKDAAGGSIQGRVVSAETGQPLSNIAVHLHTHGNYVDPWIHPSGYTTTDANGEYEFFTLAPNNYKVAFSDYKDIYADQHNGNKPTLGGAPELTIDDDTDLTVNVEMVRGATVSVAFDSTTDKELTSAYVTAFRWNEHDAWLPVGYGYSDSGAVEVTALPTGKYVFYVAAEFGWYYGFNGWYGDAESMETAEQVWIEAGTDLTLDTVIFGQNTGVIEGSVTFPDGSPWGFALVEIYSAESNARYFSQSLRTNSDGSFTSPPLPNGSYKILVHVQGDTYLRTWYGNAVRESDAQTVTVSSGEVESAPITMQLAGKITGTVTPPGNYSADSVLIRAFRFLDGEWQSVGYTRLSNNNTYILGSLPADDYLIYFRAQKSQPYPLRPFEFGEWYGDVASRNDAVIVTVGEGETVRGIDATMGNIIASNSRKDGVISGNIDSAKWLSRDGFEARAYLETSPYRGPNYWELQTTVPVDSEGNYLFDALPHGRYVIGFYDTSSRHKPEYYNNVADIESAIVLTISAETPSISGINAILQLSQSHVK